MAEQVTTTRKQNPQNPPEVNPEDTDEETTPPVVESGNTPQGHWANIKMQFAEAGFEPVGVVPTDLYADQTLIGIWDKAAHTYPNGSGGTWTANPGDYMLEMYTGEIRPWSPENFSNSWEEVEAQPQARTQDSGGV